MAILVNDLNEDHDIYTFIRKVHEAYEMMVGVFPTLFKVGISHALYQAEKVKGVNLLLEWAQYIVNLMYEEIERK